MEFLADNSNIKRWMNISTETIETNFVVINKALVVGEESDNGFIQGSIDGSLVVGNSTGSDSLIDNDAKGSILFGNADGGGKILLGVTAEGSLCGGDSEGTLARIECLGKGSLCLGHVRNDGDIFVASDAFGSVAMGRCHINNSGIHAEAEGSFCFGHANGGFIKTQGLGSVAFGYVTNSAEETIASGTCSMVLGKDVKNDNDYSICLGKYGSAYTTNGAGPSDVEGLGSIQIVSGLTQNATTSVSIKIGTQTDSDTSPFGGMIGGFFYSAQPSFSSFFEWIDDEIKTVFEDRIGRFVTLVEGDKIKICQSDEKPLGVLSQNTGFVMNTEELSWKNVVKYDKYDRKIYKNNYIEPLKRLLVDDNKIKLSDNMKSIIYEDSYNCINKLVDCIKEELGDVYNDLDITSLCQKVTDIDPILSYIPNLDYDRSVQYIPRCNRPEWAIVALKNLVCVDCEIDVEVGTYVDCGEDGIACLGESFLVLKKTADDVCQIYLN